jgi:hypothetical protein
MPPVLTGSMLSHAAQAASFNQAMERTADRRTLHFLR